MSEKRAEHESPVKRDLSPLWLILILFAATAWIYQDIVSWMISVWESNPDYSHGYLVPFFSLVVLYLTRDELPTSTKTSWGALVIGIVLIAGAFAIRATGIYTRILTLEALTLIPCLIGIILILGGWRLTWWAGPAVAFLVFMIPLPQVIAGSMSNSLQTLATKTSTYSLQTLGIPAMANGNIISLSENTIGVAEACSGIRMLYSFVALSVGMCLVITRPWWEKIVICCSALLIAVLANTVRITATGLAYEFGSPELADKIFHDLAGWLMMPFAVVLLGLELAILARLFVEPKQERPLVVTQVGTT